MKILGISCFYHDSAIALIDNGVPIFAAQEERYTRVKHDSNFPHKSIESMLNTLKIEPSEIEAVVFYEKPLLKFDRLITTYLEIAPKGFETFKSALDDDIVSDAKIYPHANDLATKIRLKQGKPRFGSQGNSRDVESALKYNESSSNSANNSLGFSIPLPKEYPDLLQVVSSFYFSCREYDT